MGGACLAITAIASSVCLLIWLIIGLSCYFGGYIPDTADNLVLKPTTAVVVSFRDVEHVCSYQCNCYTSCVGSGSSQSCSTHCQTCYEPCWDHYVSFEFTPSPALCSNPTNTTFEKFMQTDLNPTLPGYPAGATFNGYYNVCLFGPKLKVDQDNCAKTTGFTIQFVFTLLPATALLRTSIASLVFVGITGGILLLMLLGIVGVALASALAACTDSVKQSWNQTHEHKHERRQNSLIAGMHIDTSHIDRVDESAMQEKHIDPPAPAFQPPTAAFEAPTPVFQPPTPIFAAPASETPPYDAPPYDAPPFEASSSYGQPPFDEKFSQGLD